MNQSGTLPPAIRNARLSRSKRRRVKMHRFWMLVAIALILAGIAAAPTSGRIEAIIEGCSYAFAVGACFFLAWVGREWK